MFKHIISFFVSALTEHISKLYQTAFPSLQLKVNRIYLYSIIMLYKCPLLTFLKSC